LLAAPDGGAPPRASPVDASDDASDLNAGMGRVRIDLPRPTQAAPAADCSAACVDELDPDGGPARRRCSLPDFGIACPSSSEPAARPAPEADAGQPEAASAGAAVAADAPDAGPAGAPERSWAERFTPTSTRFYGSLRSRVALDTRWDSRPGEAQAENIAESRTHAVAGAEARFGDEFKMVVEGRLRQRAVEQRAPAGQYFWGFNGQAAKATYEATPGEIYLDWYTKYADLRFGNQVLSLGAGPQGAPADVLGPNDIREGALFGDPADVKLPVLAAKASGEVEGVRWTAIYVPFFVPNRFDLYGQDEALLQPYPGVTPPSLPLDRSVEDRSEQSLMETERPKDLPQNGDVGFRLTTKLGPVTVGADYAYTREKLPAVVVDPELKRFLGEGSQAAFTDPATALSLSQRFGRGEKLLTGTYHRYQVGEVEASGLFGPVQIDADLGYSPKRLFVNSKLDPVFHDLATGVVTVADARGTALQLAFSAVLLWVRDIPQGEQLLLIDLRGAEAKAHDTVGAALIGLVGYRWMEDKLEGELRLFFDARQLSRAAGARLTWNFNDHVHGTLGGEYNGGPQVSPLGYFRRNDNVYVELKLDL
jgi:hypothetical protein